MAALASIGTGLLFGLGFAAATTPDSPPLGWVFMGAGVLGALWILWRVGLRRHRALTNDAELARWVEAQRPRLNSSLVTAVELARVPREAVAGSGALVGETTRLAAAAIAGIDVKALGDRAGRSRRHIQAGLIITIVAVGFVLAPALWERGWEHLSYVAPVVEDDGSQWVDVAVGQIELEIRPPAYTKLGPRRLPRGLGEVTALVGSEVAIKTSTLMGSVAEAGLVLESNPDARWALDLKAEGRVFGVEGTFQVGADDRYRFSLRLEDGTIVEERTWRRVSAQEDLVPEVTLVLPESDMEVKPDDRIDFFFEASDDYGLDRIELVAMSDDGDELSRQSVREAGAARIEKGNGIIDIAKLGLEPGESADVYFEARDLRQGDDGPGIGKSAMRRLTLYSPADEHELFLGSLETILDQLIDILADRIESPLDGKALGQWPSHAPSVKGIVSTMAQILGELEVLVRNFSTDPMASDALREGVRAVHDRLLTIHEQESNHFGRWEKEPIKVNLRVMIELLHRLNDEGVIATETSIFELKGLIDDARKDSIMDLGRQMLETQNEMMELLKKLKENDDPQAREAALKKLKKLQEKMQQLQRELAKLQEKSPYENQNPAQRPNDRQMETADMKSTMEKIEELMKEGKYDEAMKLLEELNKSTQEMMAGLQDDLDSMGGRMSAAASKRQNEFMQELDKMADGQRGLQGETGDVGGEMDDRLAQEAKDAHGEGLKAARDGAKSMRKSLEGAKDSSLHPDDQRALDGLGKKAAALEDALDSGRLEQASALAKELSEGIGKLKGEVGESASRESDEGRLKGLKGSGDKLGEASEMSSEIAEKLGEMGAGGPKTPNSPEQARLDRLSQQQRALKERLDQMGQKLDDMEQDSPGIKEELGPKLDEASEKMGEAGEELGQGQPRGAESSQQKALEKLREAQQAMQERMEKQGKQKPGQGGGVGVNDPKEKVGIPDEDPYAAPRNLREEIMRAMQEDAPEKYKEVIRRFYEELTR